MKLNVERIEEDFDEHPLGDWGQAATAQSLEGKVEVIEGSLFVKRMDESIFVEGDLKVRVQRECDRCGAPVIWLLESELKLAYVPAEASGTANREIFGGDLDVGFYAGGSIDLADVLREHFALSTPDRLACDVVGVSLATGAKCQSKLILKESEVKPVDTRFAALKGLKLD